MRWLCLLTERPFQPRRVTGITFTAVTTVSLIYGEGELYKFILRSCAQHRGYHMPICKNQCQPVHGGTTQVQISEPMHVLDTQSVTVSYAQSPTSISTQ